MATDIFIHRNLDRALSGLYHGDVSDGLSGEAARTWRGEHLSLIRNLQPAQWSAPRVGLRSNSGADARSSLTYSDVVEIRTMYAGGGCTYADLAEMYEVSEMTIWRVVTGKTFTDAGGPICDKDNRRNGPKRWSLGGAVEIEEEVVYGE